MCLQPLDYGACNNRIERWYFDQMSVSCRGFIYRGCKGNANNFLSKEDCMGSCSGLVGKSVARHRNNSKTKSKIRRSALYFAVSYFHACLVGLKLNRTRQLAKYGVKLSAVLAYHVPLANAYGTASPDCGTYSALLGLSNHIFCNNLIFFLLFGVFQILWNQVRNLQIFEALQRVAKLLIQL